MDNQSVQRAWFLILLGVVTVAFLWLTLDFIQPVFWAAVLATIFDPLQKQLEERLGGRRSQAALLSLLIIIVVVFLPVVLLGVAVSQEALNFYNRIQDNSVDLQTFVTRIDPAVRDAAARIGIDPGSIEQRVYQGVGAVAQLIATRAIVVGQNLLAVVAKTALMLYLLFFFLRDGDELLATLADAIPMGDGRQRTLFRQFASVTRATLKGTILVGMAQGLLGGVLFLVLGLRAPVFWGVIMAMLSLLPLVGPAIVWVPAAIYLLVTGSVTKGIVLIVGGVLVVGTADNVLRPILVGRETRMPDYMILLSTLGGLSVFGAAGFVAGPVLAALFLSVWGMFAKEQRSIVLSRPEAPPPGEL